MRTRALVLLLALGLIVSACVSSNDSANGVATLETETTVSAAADDQATTEEVDAEQAMLDLAACLRAEGVDIDDPTVDADGNVQFGGFRGGPGEAGDAAVDREAMRAAMAACQEQLEGVVLGFGGRDFDPTELQDTMVDYAACMRENGYDMDDPDFSSLGPGAGGEPGEGGGGGPFGQIDQDDPDFVAANELCGEILGSLPGAGGRGPGRGSG
ncbi:MAG: hypothetical protein QNJ77_11090 [Acidimicrobiia bacterium]|nr:hypothetical protein [Acidimicrobiia bacterium]